MGTELKIDVADLDPNLRRALEEVIGRALRANQRLYISVRELEVPASAGPPPQALEDWTHVYEGLSDEEIADLERVILTRADLTRPSP